MVTEVIRIVAYTPRNPEPGAEVAAECLELPMSARGSSAIVAFDEVRKDILGSMVRNYRECRPLRLSPNGNEMLWELVVAGADPTEVVTTRLNGFPYEIEMRCYDATAVALPDEGSGLLNVPRGKE